MLFYLLLLEHLLQREAQKVTSMKQPTALKTSLTSLTSLLPPPLPVLVLLLPPSTSPFFSFPKSVTIQPDFLEDLKEKKPEITGRWQGELWPGHSGDKAARAVPFGLSIRFKCFCYWQTFRMTASCDSSTGLSPRFSPELLLIIPGRRASQRLFVCFVSWLPNRGDERGLHWKCFL